MMGVRDLLRRHLVANVKRNRPIIGVAVGSGLSAKQAFAGGADFVLALNAGRFRMAGITSAAALMPFKNSNELVLDFGTKEIIPRTAPRPVIFGACATDPTIEHERLLDKIIKSGFCGVNNFPTVGLIDGIFRTALEESGLGFEREVEFMRKAVKAGLFTIGFVFNEEQSALMAAAGVDIICAHLGFTVGGKTGAKHAMAVDYGIDLVNRIFAVANKINSETIKLIYGGPITTPAQAEFFYNRTMAAGYIGGSSFERIPAEETIEKITGQFKNIIKLQKECESLKRELRKKLAFDEIVGQSRIMQNLYDLVSKVADKDVNVLVCGESGTGKELVVRALHYNSRRFKQPFIKVNCAAIPETLLESELFGHEKGAFTGATQKRLGLFELADKGTLFLDEIGDMSLNIQAKLLRVIQQQEFQRVGGSKTIKVDVRIICATNADLRSAVAAGRFREDLYYRLNVVTIRTPPLRNHTEDIPLLVRCFLDKINIKFNRKIQRLSAGALDMLMQYNWPGNVRELEHALESAAILCDGDVITSKDLQLNMQYGPWNNKCNGNNRTKGYDKTLGIVERQLIIEALEKFNWNRQKTSENLGITRRTLFNKMKKYNIKTK